MADLGALKKRQRLGKVDERTLSLIKRAKEADAAAAATAARSEAIAGSQGTKQGSKKEQESDDDSEDDDVLGSIAIDWRAKR